MRQRSCCQRFFRTHFWYSFSIRWSLESPPSWEIQFFVRFFVFSQLCEFCSTFKKTKITFSTGKWQVLLYLIKISIKEILWWVWSSWPRVCACHISRQALWVFFKVNLQFFSLFHTKLWLKTSHKIHAQKFHFSL